MSKPEMYVIGTQPVTGCSFIPCANFGTAVYYQNQLHKSGPIDQEILESSDTKNLTAPWYVSILS